MINELYRLTEALDQANIKTERTHPKYKLIPKVTKKAPCVHIIFDSGHIYKVENIEKEMAAQIRKYGSNQGTFPALNLAPLYRLKDESEKKTVSDLIEGKSTDFDIEKIREFCRVNNWGKKFRNKFHISMQDVPEEIAGLFQKNGMKFPAFEQLIEETEFFVEPEQLHAELAQAAFTMLEQKKGIALALQILFYSEKAEKSAEKDYGTLSVVLDCRKLIDQGLSVAAASFTSILNQKLLETDAEEKKEAAEKEMDAFGQSFVPLEEPMPTVKLAAGFEVSLRTMFRGQPCQSRYGRIENATYPISKEMRFKLQSALAWLSDAGHKEITWISTDKNEALFAYPETLRENMYSMVSFCKRRSMPEEKTNGTVNAKISKKSEFEAAAEGFIKELHKTKKPGTDPMAERIQYFVLRKLDKARTRVVYTYNTSPAQIEHCSDQWSLGCRNLPRFFFGQPATLFPMDVSDILNQVWRQDGKLSTDKFKPIPRYHGMQLLFGTEMPAVRRDLFILMNNVTNLGPHLGKSKIAREGYNSSQILLLRQTQNALALMGLLLYQLGSRKENYMQEFPYLFGQMLKVSDDLHEMYCKVVRDNDVPNALAGSGLYVAGAEQPYKTLAVLGHRMIPYIEWAKSYRGKGILKKNEESWRAGWYLSLYEDAATKLYAVWGRQTRFNEEEKAQYFIGYLAGYPKIGKAAGQQDGERPLKNVDGTEDDSQEK